MFDNELDLENEVDTEEIGAEESTEETTDSDVTEEPKSKPNDVPLSRFLEEKQKRKDLEKRLKNYENNEMKSKLKEKWIGKGFEDDYAEEQANIEYRIHIQDTKLKEMEIDSEISELSKEDDYFADALEYKSEIKAKMKEKGLTAEEAYLILRKKTRDREVKVDREQKALTEKRGAGVKTSTPTATTTTPKNPYPLDADDRKALAGLQRMMPDAGWTAEKYYKSRYGKK